MGFSISTYQSAQDFLAATGPMLYRRETVNNLILGVSQRLVNEPGFYENPFFATINDTNGHLILVAVMTPPHNLILAGEDQAHLGFKTLISYLRNTAIQVPGVIAPVELADPFANEWTHQTRETHQIKMNMRVYELRRVTLPIFPEGEFRRADIQDIPTIAAWIQAFALEALHDQHDLDLSRAEQLVTQGNVFVWFRNGLPVSMTMKNRPIAHSITITAVYTPPDHRRKGYAGALVAQLSQRLLDEGYQFINLFTDLDNPTSNKIYQEVGYRPVCDFRTFHFKPLTN